MNRLALLIAAVIGCTIASLLFVLAADAMSDDKSLGSLVIWCRVAAMACGVVPAAVTVFTWAFSALLDVLDLKAEQRDAAIEPPKHITDMSMCEALQEMRTYG